MGTVTGWNFRLHVARAAAAALALFLAVPVAIAETTAGPPGAAAEESNPLEAIVGVEASVPMDARTASGLGRERAGNGVVIDASGLVLTIGYIILEAEEVWVTTRKGKRIPADIVAYDHETGFGLLRTALPPDVPAISLGSSDGLTAPTRVLAAAFEESRPVLVVSRREFAGYWEYLLDNAIFTSPPIKEFGGAALIDRDGRLVGVGSLIVNDALPTDEPVPGNMFVPIDLLGPILADLLAEGRAQRPTRPWIGLYPEEVRGRIFVTRVADGGPAEAAGITAGDLVLAVDGVAITSVADFYRKMWALGEAGSSVPLTILKTSLPETVTLESLDRYDWLRLGKGL